MDALLLLSGWLCCGRQATEAQMLDFLNVLLIVGAGVAWPAVALEDAGKRNGGRSTFVSRGRPSHGQGRGGGAAYRPEFLSIAVPSARSARFAVKIALVEDGAMSTSGSATCATTAS